MIYTFMKLLYWILDMIRQFIRKRTGKVITLDTGKRVILGKKISEGGFSYVFEAFDADDNKNGHTTTHTTTTLYALKRIHCPEPELLQSCRDEAAVHRAVQNQKKHPNVMPLLGMTVQQNDCYMLFPFCKQSLRDLVNHRNPFLHQHQPRQDDPAPWSDATALNVFLRIVAGVQALHDVGYTHRDVKLENVLLLSTDNTTSSSSSSSSSTTLQPVLMDFGSAGPLMQNLDTRRDVLEVIERAAQHTTLPYRPPELFEGGCRTGDDPLDYRSVDVWMLGCTLHALLYGASPFECEFTRTGGMKIVDCTHLSILGSLSQPRAPPIANWYSPKIRTQLLEPMLNKDRHRRPTLIQVMETTEQLIEQVGGRVDRGRQDSFDDVTADLDNISILSRVV